MNPPFELTYDRHTARVLSEIAGERARQAVPGEPELADGTRGPSTRPAREHSRHYREQAEAVGGLTWEHLLTEAYSWAMAEADPTLLRGGLVRLAARAVAWVEAIDRRAAGVGSDQDAPSAPQVRLQAAEQADPVAQYPPERLRASEAVPDTVLQAAGAAAWPGLPAQQLDQLAAERAAGYQPAPDFDGLSTVGRREAQREGERAVREGLAAALDARVQADTTWPGPDLAEVGKWAQDFTTDEDGAPGSVSELDEHVWEEWGRTVGARTDRDRYWQLTILAAWVVATMRELRLRETRREPEPAEGGRPDRRGLLAELTSDAQDLGTYDLGASHDPDDAYQAGRLDEAVTAGQPTIGVLRDVVDLAAELLSDSSFHERGHPGYAARRTGWIAETRLAALRARLDRARAALTNLEPDQENRRA